MQHVRTAVDAAAARGRDARLAQPVSRALLPQWAARLVGLAALGAVGALEWQRLIGGYSSARALLWVVAGLVAAALTLAAARARPGLRRAGALTGAILGSALAGYVLSGAALFYLKPHHWDDLFPGLVGGLQSLGTVRLPYVSADPWPGIALQVLGAELLVLAGLLTFWPRAENGERDARKPLSAPDRGYQFLALATLLIVVASPVVSLGGTRSLLLGLVLAALTVVFLWLERLPLRPGLGVAALLAVALAGALPLAAVADRGEPWFDYRSFAEGLGPDDPVHFSWSQTYGPINWPRDGNEVMRVSSSEPMYWKARDLDVFNDYAWQARTTKTDSQQGDEPWAADVPESWRNVPGWTQDISVSIRRMHSTQVLGAGTIMQVRDESRPVHPGLASGTMDSDGALRRGDSYTLQVYSPKPDPGALSEAESGTTGMIADDLVLTVPFRKGLTAPPGVYLGLRLKRVHQAEVHFRGFSSRAGSSFAAYPQAGRAEYNVDRVMRRSVYARTWALAKKLKRGAKHPYDYVKAVDAYLRGPEFTYSERPKQPPPGVAPLEYFINVSHEGYCQHYAGAMALLLRMGGIPARVATGFSPGGYSARHKAWIVRDTDAHAWVEAWFDHYGWVTFDPTPDATPARSQIAALAPPSTLPAISPDRIPSGSGNANQVRGPLGVRPDLLLDREAGGEGGSLGSNGTPWWPFALGGAALLLLLIWLVALRRGPRGLTPMDRAIAELETALRLVGRPVTTGTTLRQLEGRLGSHSAEAGAYLRFLSAGRYAPAPPPPPPTGRRALRRALAQGLGPGGRLRALWALPPRMR